MQTYQCRLPDGASAYFIDTPGFDDTFQQDTDVLRKVADWLNAAYENGILLTGIVYLHRISDTRLGGSGMRNLRMFKKLCGEDNLGNIVLATTMWSLIGESEAEQQNAARRENELRTKENFWGFMIERGSRVFRQDRGSESAMEIVQYLVGRRRPITLDIQRDMVDRRLPLDETAAGREVQAGIAEQRKLYERKLAQTRTEMQQALKNRDKEHQRELQDIQGDIEAKLRESEAAVQSLKAGREQLRRELQADWEREKQRLTRQYEDAEAGRRAAERARAADARRAEAARASRRAAREAEEAARHSHHHHCHVQYPAPPTYYYYSAPSPYYYMQPFPTYYYYSY